MKGKKDYKNGAPPKKIIRDIFNKQSSAGWSENFGIWEKRIYH